MFKVNDDLSIYVTRSDAAVIRLIAANGNERYTFAAGDVVRINVFKKKDCHSVVLQKDFPVTEDAQEAEIILTSEDTQIGKIISKPEDYWYEIELNPETTPQTIIGYDENGPKVFRLFPEGGELE